jgi:hypothetical protein
VQTCRDDFGVVDDERVAGAQQLRQITHRAILERRGHAGTHHQETRGVARRRRPQRDAVFRQNEVEEIGAHASATQPRLARS